MGASSGYLLLTNFMNSSTPFTYAVENCFPKIQLLSIYFHKKLKLTLLCRLFHKQIELMQNCTQIQNEIKSNLAVCPRRRYFSAIDAPVPSIRVPDVALPRRYSPHARRPRRYSPQVLLSPGTALPSPRSVQTRCRCRLRSGTPVPPRRRRDQYLGLGV